MSAKKLAFAANAGVDVVFPEELPLGARVMKKKKGRESRVPAPIQKGRIGWFQIEASEGASSQKVPYQWFGAWKLVRTRQRAALNFCRELEYSGWGVS